MSGTVAPLIGLLLALSGKFRIRCISSVQFIGVTANVCPAMRATA